MFNKVKCSKYPKEKCFHCENKVFEPCMFCKHNLYQDIRFRDKLSDFFVPNFELAYKKILIIAEMGAGKDTVADFLVQNYNFKKMKLGKKIRSEVDNYVNMLNIPKEKSRELYVKYGQGMRSIFNQNIWCDELYNNISPEDEKIIIADGRQMNELKYFLERGFTPIGLIASDEVRNSRTIARDGYSQVNEDRKNDSTEASARKCIKMIRDTGGVIIENNSTLENLYKKIDKIMKT